MKGRSMQSRVKVGQTTALRVRRKWIFRLIAAVFLPALLLLGLQNRSHVESQTQHGPVFGLGVGTDDVAHAIVEDAGDDVGIDAERAVQLADRLGCGMCLASTL